MFDFYGCYFCLFLCRWILWKYLISFCSTILLLQRSTTNASLRTSSVSSQKLRLAAARREALEHFTSTPEVGAQVKLDVFKCWSVYMDSCLVLLSTCQSLKKARETSFIKMSNTKLVYWYMYVKILQILLRWGVKLWFGVGRDRTALTCPRATLIRSAENQTFLLCKSSHQPLLNLCWGLR